MSQHTREKDRGAYHTALQKGRKLAQQRYRNTFVGTQFGVLLYVSFSSRGMLARFIPKD